MERLLRATINSWRGLLAATRSEEAFRLELIALVLAIPVAFLVGLLNTRLQRSAVADLVVALGGPLTPAQVRDEIARTLRDESLVLGAR